MEYWHNLVDKEIYQLSRWISTFYSPKHVLLVGTKEARLVQHLNNFGIFTSCFDTSDVNFDDKTALLTLNNQPDLMFFSQDAMTQLTPNLFAALANNTRQPGNLLVAFTSQDLQSSVPVIAKTLFNVGFTRNFSIAPWANDQHLVYAYRKHGADISSTIEAYEAELWRLTQLSEKRRRVLQDYREEIYREVITFQALEAFTNSRTGQAIKSAQRAREKVLPLGSFQERVIKFFFRAVLAVRRDGLVRFVRAIPMRINQRVTWQKGLWRLHRLQASEDQCLVDIEPVITEVECKQHDLGVDIVICVHNAIDDVKRCLYSLQQFTLPPYQLILVDDGSGLETKEFLESFASKNDVSLLRNEQASGYTRAANQGLRASKAELVVLLNSDTILSPAWLDKMVCCAQSDPIIGMIGPLSNTASWQSVPKVEDQGDWAENPLPDGFRVEDMSDLLTGNVVPLYPRIPFLNGFCLMIKRALIDDIGIFDEDSFGAGYGEENDYALRARKAGWQLALADNVYIYHAQSKSYSTEKRQMLSERATKILVGKHGDSIVQEGVEYCHYNRVLEGIRARADVALKRRETVRQGMIYQGKRILFILPITKPGGGTNVVRTESQAMKKMGVEVEFFNLSSNEAAFCAAYPNLEIPMIYGEIEDIPAIASRYDAIIATYNPTVRWMRDIQDLHGKPVLGYYVQDFEPLLYPSFSKDYEQALESYSLIPRMILFTKTDWNRKIVQENTGRSARVVGPSLDINLYRPRPRQEADWPQRPLKIAAMVRPESAYREPYKTMQLLKKVAKKYGGRVEICIFGTKLDNLDFLALPQDFPWKLYGIIPQEKVANLLSEVDIFVDYSSHQAMGLTALEAMACGCAVLVPSKGGATSFARNEQNSLVVDTASFDAVYEGLDRIIKDDALRFRIQRNAIYDTCSYFPEQAALNILSTLFKGDL